MGYITVMRRVYGSGGESWDEYAEKFGTRTEALAFVDMMNDQFIGEFYFIGE
jgi:hypothetical protein